jgi:hypothetical protein
MYFIAINDKIAEILRFYLQIGVENRYNIDRNYSKSDGKSGRSRLDTDHT